MTQNATSAENPATSPGNVALRAATMVAAAAMEVVDSEVAAMEAAVEVADSVGAAAAVVVEVGEQAGWVCHHA